MRIAWKGFKQPHFASKFVAMAIAVEISGQKVSLEADLTESVQSLAERARKALGVGQVATNPVSFEF